jgi:hypothetical protein
LLYVPKCLRMMIAVFSWCLIPERIKCGRLSIQRGTDKDGEASR